MKVRHGFVSNSSSSSFVCDVCGRECSGMDMCLEDASMYECVNGHIYCKDHAISVEKPKVIDPDEDDDYGDDYYERPEAECPVCNMISMTRSDLIAYLLKEVNLTENQVVKNVKDKYQPDGFVAGAYKQFVKDLKA